MTMRTRKGTGAGCRRMGAACERSRGRRAGCRPLLTTYPMKWSPTPNVYHDDVAKVSGTGGYAVTLPIPSGLGFSWWCRSPVLHELLAGCPPELPGESPGYFEGVTPCPCGPYPMHWLPGDAPARQGVHLQRATTAYVLHVGLPDTTANVWVLLRCRLLVAQTAAGVKPGLKPTVADEACISQPEGLGLYGLAL